MSSPSRAAAAAPEAARPTPGVSSLALKPLDVRKLTDAAVLARLRHELSGVTGARLFLQSASDIHFGGRQGNAAYQYTLLSDDLPTLDAWTPKITAALAE